MAIDGNSRRLRDAKSLCERHDDDAATHASTELNVVHPSGFVGASLMDYAAGIACLTLFAIACASSPPQPSPGEEPYRVTRRSGPFVSADMIMVSPVGWVADVHVHSDALLERSRVNRMVYAGGPKVIHDAVLQEMVAAGHVNSESAFNLHVTLTEIRLRSTGMVVWFGNMIGPDVLGAVVTVWKDQDIVRRYPVRVSSLQGDMYRGGVGGRYTRLVAALAESVVGGL